MAQLAAAVEPGFDGCDGMILNRRYMIVVSAPLMAFDAPTARAFPVEDLDGAEGVSAGAPMLFARLNHTGLPSRDWEIDVLRELRHPHLMALIDSGEIEFEAAGQAARAMVLEYPQGGRLMAPEGAAPMPWREGQKQSHRTALRRSRGASQTRYFSPRDSSRQSFHPPDFRRRGDPRRLRIERRGA